MAKRGFEVRGHILSTAQDVFLEMGFERASMDAIAARGATSKRTVYAHFESKEKLFLAVVDLVRRHFLRRLKKPSDYPGQPQAALVSFCGRFLDMLLHAKTIRMCRLSVAEAARFPEGCGKYYDAIFSEVHRRVVTHLSDIMGLAPKYSVEASEGIIGRLIYPGFPRVLFGIDAPNETLDDEGMWPRFEREPVRRAVAEMVEPFYED